MPKKAKKTTVLYDGADFCHTDSCCPIVEQKGSIVTIHDPQKPQKGRLNLSIKEFNDLIKNAKPAE